MLYSVRRSIVLGIAHGLDTDEILATMGGLYSFGDAASSNLREKDDAWNQFYGGALAGACIGVYKRTLPALFGYSAGVGIMMGLFSWGGGNIGGIYSYMNEEEKAAWQKQMFSTDMRRPRSEVLEQLRDAPRSRQSAAE